MVCGSVGMLPLWERILETLPFLEILLPVPVEAEAEAALVEAEGSSGELFSASWGRTGSPDIAVCSKTVVDWQLYTTQGMGG